MPIEVELKARLASPDATIARLRERAPDQPSTYRDTYYDWPDRRLEHGGRQEVRLRIIETIDGTRYLLTFKGAMLDAASTPEYETAIDDAEAAHAILSALGLEPVISFTKQCENFRFTFDNRDIIATVVRVPEVDGVFLEVETLVPDDGDRAGAKSAVRGFLESLGLGNTDLESTYYVDLVRSQQNTTPSRGGSDEVVSN